MLVASVSSGCVRRPQRSSGPQTVGLHVEATPAKVELFVDDAYRGELTRWRGGVLPVAPGLHRLELRCPGYFPLLRTIDVGPEGASFRAQLRALPPG